MKSSIYLLSTLLLLFGCMNKTSQQSEAMNTAENDPVVKAELFLPSKAALGEGPIWNHLTKDLYWVDIEGLKLHILNVSDKSMETFDTPTRIGTVVPIHEKKSLVALEDGIYIFDRDSATFQLFASVEGDNPATRLNDGKCDPQGRLWIGSMYYPQDQSLAALYSVDAAGNVKLQKNKVTISNGIVWTADSKTMYYIDSPTNEIKAYDFDGEIGSISNERVVLTIPKEKGEPDGMAIDENDNLWVGLWNGNAVLQINPRKGEVIGRIAVPAHNVTACAFGGANLDSLFITTASLDMTEEEQKRFPDAGSIFVAVPGVKGVKSNFFRLSE